MVVVVAEVKCSTRPPLRELEVFSCTQHPRRAFIKCCVNLHLLSFQEHDGHVHIDARTLGSYDFFRFRRDHVHTEEGKYVSVYRMCDAFTTNFTLTQHCSCSSRFQFDDQIRSFS